MKIHFSNVNFSSSSGPNSFGGRLAQELALRNYQIVDKDEDYDIFLCFIEPASVPDQKARFIHRLDGIWFKPAQFKTHNVNIKSAYNKCDHVIWQSNFDKNMVLLTSSLAAARSVQILGNKEATSKKNLLKSLDHIFK